MASVPTATAHVGLSVASIRWLAMGCACVRSALDGTIGGGIAIAYSVLGLGGSATFSDHSLVVVR